MRVLRLGTGDGAVVDLHPSVSLLSGLTDGQRTALRRGFTAIGTGLEPTVPGLVESHGLLLDATQSDLDLLGVPTCPLDPVATPAEVEGAVPADELEQLQAAAQDLVRSATDRWRSSEALADAGLRPTPAPTGDERERAADLRSRIARHRASGPEPVRAALDAIRDRRLAGAAVEPEPLAGALAAVGLDVRDLGLPTGELVRLAEDWLDEQGREADWVVGAEVELDAVEDALASGRADPEVTDRAGSAGAVRLSDQAARAAHAHADAVARVDRLRARLVEGHRPRPGVDDLVWYLLARLAAHDPVRLAGAVPLLLDGVLTHLDDAAAVHVLDRVAGLAGRVQLVIIDEHPAAAAWVAAAGIRGGAHVAPSLAAAPAVSP